MLLNVDSDSIVDGIYEAESTGCGPATSVTKYYMDFGRVIASRTNGVLSYSLADHLGSTVQQINGVTPGTAIKYFPFGAPRNGTPSPERAYTGQQRENDQSGMGLYYYHARFYSTTTGHFASADTSTKDGLNRYAYVRGNPILNSDPTGHCLTDMEGPHGCGLDAHAYSVSDYQREASGAADPFVELNRLNDVLALQALAATRLPAAILEMAAAPGTDAASFLSDIKGNIESCPTCDFIMANGLAFVATGGLSALAAPAALAAEGGTEAVVADRVVIGAMQDLRVGKLAWGERTLLSQLQGDLGSVEANWARNLRVLQSEMASGNPIRDASVLENGVPKEFPLERLITLERQTLSEAGWEYHFETRLWSPGGN